MEGGDATLRTAARPERDARARRPSRAAAWARRPRGTAASRRRAWGDGRAAKLLVKQHSTIGTTLNLLIRSGFAVDRVEEFRPNEEQVAAAPELAEELERPMVLLVAARR